MKILTVVFSLEKGGTQRAAQNFATGYLENGHDSRLLVTKKDGLRHSELVNSGVQVFLHLTENNVSEINAWNPDIVHLHSHGLEMCDVESILGCTLSAKVIETNVFSVPSPWSHLLDVSYQLSEWCNWLYGKRSKKNWPSDIVPYPVDVDAFTKAPDNKVVSFREKLSITPDDILLGRIGQAFDGKWSPLLIKSFSKLRMKEHRLRLLLVNPPTSIKKQSADSQFSSSIFIVDSIVGDTNLAIAYSAIDIFVLIADQGESFGMVLAETQLCETPVVTLSTPWGDNSQCEVVGNMRGGLVATTTKGLEAAILYLCHDSDLRKMLGKNGRKSVVERYNSKNVAKLALDKITSNNLIRSKTNVVSLFKKSFDRPSNISLFLLKYGCCLVLLRYANGYEPFSSFPKRLMVKFRSTIQKS